MSDVPVSVPAFATLQDDVDDALADDQNIPNGEIEGLATLVGMLGVAQSKSRDFLDAIVNLFLPTIKLSYVDASTVQASAGRCTPQNSGGSQRVIRKNTSTTNITGADLDAAGPTLANSTDYYVYASGDTVATTCGFVISTNASTPAGLTIFQLIGGFSTDGSGQVIQTTVWSMAGKKVVDFNAKFTASKITTTAAFPSDTSIPQNTEGVEIVNVDHFVKKTTNKLLLIGIVTGGMGGTQIIGCGIFSTKNGTPADAVAAAVGSYTATNETAILMVMTSRSESSVGKCNYSLRAGGDSGGSTFYANANPATTNQIFNGVAQSGLIVLELE